MADLTKMSTLTPKQQKVLTMMCCGMKQTAIAKEFNVSRSAVNHLSRAIYAKLGVASVTQALVVAVLFELVDTVKVKEAYTAEWERTGDPK